MNENCAPSVITVASLAAPELEVYSITQDGKRMHVYDALHIRILSEIFQAPYRVIITPDGEFGKPLADGNWTGLIGMVKRSEVDLAVGGIALLEEVSHVVHFSYPFLYTEMSFMTDKPKPLSSEMALLYPFSIKLWILIVAVVFFVSLFLSVLTKRKETYGTVLFRVIGSFLEKDIHFEVQKLGFRFLLGTWLIFVFVITNGYKANLLSFLTVPTLVGIRDIQDLAKAAEQNSIRCYAFRGVTFWYTLLESELDAWRSIGKCLDRNVDSFGEPEEVFIEAPPNKAFFAGKVYLVPYNKEYLISSDSFFNIMLAFPISRNFKCRNRLNRAVGRLFEAGVFLKLMQEEYLGLELSSHRFIASETISHKISMGDLQGAFLLLVFGYILALVTFFIEIVINNF